MSASSKKKMNSQAASAKLTERQLAEQQEAKKLKLYTILFTAVLAALVVIAVTVGVTRMISASGTREKKTIAATVGSHQLSNAELSYFYIDAVNNFASTYGAYAAMYGLDVTKPLNEQVTDAETGMTWADDFIDSAIENAKTVYALSDEAAANGYTLSTDQELNVATLESNLEAYATIYGFENANAYLKAMYGNGANMKDYLEYYRRTAVANEYFSEYQNQLSVSDEEIKAKDKENPDTYNSYSFNYYYLPVNKFLTGGTTGEDGTVTYSDEENAAAAKAAQTAVKSLVGKEITSVEEFDAAIKALDVNVDSDASSIANVNQRYTSVNSAYIDWIADSTRKEGDKTWVANSSETGYYAVYFVGSTDNTDQLVNVRHILFGFEGETDEDGTYPDEVKAAAKASAEEILALWKSGDATEENFAALAVENSTDTGSASNGGLYENVYPGQMVPAFNDWIFDASRKSGDTGIVETNYGYHVMYFVGNGELNYRDYLIKNDIINEEMNSWYDALIEATPAEKGNTSYMRTNLVINSGN